MKVVALPALPGNMTAHLLKEAVQATYPLSKTHLGFHTWKNGTPALHMHQATASSTGHPAKMCSRALLGLLLAVHFLLHFRRRFWPGTRCRLVSSFTLFTSVARLQSTCWFEHVESPTEGGWRVGAACPVAGNWALNSTSVTSQAGLKMFCAPARQSGFII